MFFFIVIHISVFGITGVVKVRLWLLVHCRYSLLAVIEDFIRPSVIHSFVITNIILTVTVFSGAKDEMTQFRCSINLL